MTIKLTTFCLCGTRPYSVVVQYYKQLCSGARRCYTCAHQDTRQEKLTFAKCIISHKTFSGIEIHRKITVSRKSLLSIICYYRLATFCLNVIAKCKLIQLLFFPKNTAFFLLILLIHTSSIFMKKGTNSSKILCGGTGWDWVVLVFCFCHFLLMNHKS